MRLWAVLLVAANLAAQDYRGEVAVQAPPSPAATAVEFNRFRFLAFSFGREGPSDIPLRGAPVQGREYFAEADLSGLQAAANVRFELTDAAGRALRTLTMWKATDSATDGEFHGFVSVPNQPFRIAAAGTARNGTAFRAVLPNVIQPSPTGPEDQVAIPPGFPPDQTQRMRQFIEAYRRQVEARAAQAGRDHPGGVIALTRAVVSRVLYEPYIGAGGAPLGLRLRYSVRFGADATVAAVPYVSPVFAAIAWRGVVSMKTLGGSITPPPVLPGAVTMSDVIVYGGSAQYRAGTTYEFTIDFMPDYVFQGSLSGRFCVHDQKYAANPASWNAIMASNAPVPLLLTISDLDFAGRIGAFYPPSLLRANFLAAGAFDCGPVPNIRF